VQAPAGAGVYWVEIRNTARRAQLSWIRSNPIYVWDIKPSAPLPEATPVRERAAMFDGTSAIGWRVEHDSASLAAVETAASAGGSEIRFRFGLAGGDAPHRVAALAYDTPNGTIPYDRIAVTIRAERPMRISVQLRAGDDQGNASRERWQRTIYVDTTAQERTVSLTDLMPVGETHTFRPVYGSIRSILFVVDATNTKPGDSGRIWIRKAELQR
jgi:hypothetical protein